MTTEEAILSCMLNDEVAAREGVARLTDDDFVTQFGKDVFNATAKNISEGIVPDLITVSRHCRHHAVGVTELSGMVSSTANYKEYIDILIEDSSLRRLQGVCADVAAEPDINRAIERLTTETGIVKNRMGTGVDYSAKSAVESTLKAMDDRILGKRPGIDTPLKRLTVITGGWQPSNLIVIAARPSVGKTAFAISCADMAIKAGKAVLFFSLEMARELIMDRLIMGRSGIDAYNYRTGKMSNEDVMKAQTAAGYYADAKIWINDKGIIGLNDIEAFSLSKKQDGLCDMVVIDYLQLMKTRQEKGRTRDGELSELTRGLKLLSKELDVPVILLSQLNRELEKRANKRPCLADLRESGAIEQDADIVLMLYRGALYGEPFVTIGNEQISTMGLGEVTIAKHRNGQTGTEYFSHNDSLTRIGSWPSQEYGS